jgi:hypothetical protein
MSLVVRVNPNCHIKCRLSNSIDTAVQVNHGDPTEDDDLLFAKVNLIRLIYFDDK